MSDTLLQKIVITQAKLFNLYTTSISHGEFDIKKYKEIELFLDDIYSTVAKTKRHRRSDGSEILKRHTRLDND